MLNIDKTPDNALIKLSTIIGTKSASQSQASTEFIEPPIIPVSRSTWWAGVKSGKFPKPIKIGERSIAWRAGDIKKLLNDLGGE